MLQILKHNHFNKYDAPELILNSQNLRDLQFYHKLERLIIKEDLDDRQMNFYQKVYNSINYISCESTNMNVSFVCRFSNLVFLNCNDNKNLNDISFLSCCKQLQFVFLMNCSISNIDSLVNHQKLVALQISGNSGITDVLVRSPKLLKLHCICKNLKSLQATSRVLVKLFVDFQNLQQFSIFTHQLKTLIVCNLKNSLIRIESIDLHRLELRNSKIQGFSLASLHDLQYLFLQDTRMKLTELETLLELRHISQNQYCSSAIAQLGLREVQMINEKPVQQIANISVNIVKLVCYTYNQMTV